MLPICFHSQHRSNICFSPKWAGGEKLRWEKWAGFVVIVHLQKPGSYTPLVQVKGSWCWGSGVVPKAGPELAPACTSAVTSDGTTPTGPAHISAWDCRLSAKGLGSRFTANANVLTRGSVLGVQTSATISGLLCASA